LIARLLRYSGPQEAAEEAIRKLVTFDEHESYRTLLLRGRGEGDNVLLVLWFGEEGEEAQPVPCEGLTQVGGETFDVVSPEEQRELIKRACETLLRALGDQRSPETEQIYNELEALSARLKRQM
jgi:hypothetical protein